MINAVRAAQTTSGARIAGLIWIQGESDAAVREYAEAYERNLEQLVAATREALHVASLPVVVARLNEASGYDHAHVVRAAQERVAARDAQVHLVDTDALALRPDARHFTADSYQRLGTMLAERIIGLDL
jgi:lysophospholipase L1-like esterase